MKSTSAPFKLMEDQQVAWLSLRRLLAKPKSPWSTRSTSNRATVSGSNTASMNDIFPVADAAGARPGAPVPVCRQIAASVWR